MPILLILSCAPPSAYDSCIAIHELACSCGDPSILQADGDTCKPSYAVDCAEYDDSVCDPSSSSWDASGCEHYHVDVPDPEAVADEMACVARALARTCEMPEEGACG